MMAFLRLILVVLVVETVFYILLSYYLRSLRHERLEEEWDERHPDRAGPSPERDAFVRRSMVNFHRTIKARLVGLVFILPTIAMMVIVYIVNYV